MTTPPEAEAVDAGDAGPGRRLHPLSWLFVLAAQLRQFVVPLVVLAAFGGRTSGPQLAPLLIAVALIAAGAAWRYFTYRYRVGSDSLFVRSGLFERSLRQIPFSRIHDVAVHRTLLHRLLGVAEVRLESAGGNRPEARMQVLGLADALALEQLIRNRGASAAAPVDAAAAGEDNGLLLALTDIDVARLGLVSNRGMVVLAGALALAWQVLPDQLAIRALTALGHQLSGHTVRLGSGWMTQAIAIMLAVPLALALLRLLSVLLALTQYHGFRLAEHGRRLTVERGLFTRRRNSVPRRRIQAWTLVESLMHRLLHRRALRIDTAVVAQQGQEARGLQELAPIATVADCDRLVQHLLPQAQWPPQQWHALYPGAWLRLWLGQLPVSLAATAAAVWYFGPWGLAALLLPAAGALIAAQHARRAGYALDDTLVAVREGWWSRHWRFAEVDKLQALQLRRSPLDRLFGTASLWLDTAGAGGLTPPLRIHLVPEPEAYALLEHLTAQVARRSLRW